LLNPEKTNKILIQIFLQVFFTNPFFKLAPPWVKKTMVIIVRKSFSKYHRSNLLKGKLIIHNLG
jgi:hypothetical protein